MSSAHVGDVGPLLAGLDSVGLCNQLVVGRVVGLLTLSRQVFSIFLQIGWSLLCMANTHIGRPNNLLIAKDLAGSKSCWRANMGPTSPTWAEF